MGYNSAGRNVQISVIGFDAFIDSGKPYEGGPCVLAEMLFMPEAFVARLQCLLCFFALVCFVCGRQSERFGLSLPPVLSLLQLVSAVSLVHVFIAAWVAAISVTAEGVSHFY